MKKQFVTTMITIFVLLSVVFYALKTYAHFPQFWVLEIGNCIMAVLSLVAFFMVKKQLDGRPHAFVRGVSGASFLKLMVCMISILAYVLLNRSGIHKPTVFILFGVYVVYTAAETILLSKVVRESK